MMHLWRRKWFRNGWWWGDKFAGWLIDQLGEPSANIVESYLSYNDVLRIKEALDARLD